MTENAVPPANASNGLRVYRASVPDPTALLRTSVVEVACDQLKSLFREDKLRLGLGDVALMSVIVKNQWDKVVWISNSPRVKVRCSSEKAPLVVYGKDDEVIAWGFWPGTAFSASWSYAVQDSNSATHVDELKYTADATGGTAELKTWGPGYLMVQYVIATGDETPYRRPESI